MTEELPDALFEAHRYLCRRGARRFVRGGLDRTDLEQVAAIGLLKACRRYDAQMQTPFEAFAWLLILGELMHHVRDFEHLVRPPRWVRTLEPRYAAALERLQQRLHREPNDAEMADELNVATPVVTALRGAQLSRSHEQMEAARGRI
jgi:RNA polymerase sigma-B factor